GDTSYWSREAKELAVEAASYAARKTAELRADEVFTPSQADDALTQLRAEDARFKSTADTLAFHGYGDISYWSRRAKQLALASATHCCLTASLCDGPMLAALGSTLETSLAQSHDTAFNGHGDMSYWSKRAKRLASQQAPQLPLDSLANVSRSQATPTSQVTELNRDLLEGLARDTFGPTGDTGFWSRQTKELAFRSAAHAAQLGMLAAAKKTHAGGQRVQAVEQFSRLAHQQGQAFQDKAWSSTGDISHWSKRSKHLALDVACAVNELVDTCDGSMVESVKPLLESALTEAREVAFDGYGDVRYWSQRAKRMAALSRTALEEAAVEVRARQADTPRGYLEASVAGLSQLSDARKQEQQRIQGQLDDIGRVAAANQPRRNQLIKRHELLRKVGMGSALATIVGYGCHSISPWFLGLAGVGALTTVGSVLGLSSIKSELAGLSLGKGDKDMLERRRQLVDLELGRLDRRLEEQNRALSVHQLAEALTAPAGPTKLEFGDEEILIGDIAVERNIG
ncbi:MAG: hypothetical protein KC910_20140, partial [Candidatus Eremiobacteraeota bacterium]|nr:hypothetical protein [Candidatus Eremiobacteraeota bacterium]